MATLQNGVADTRGSIDEVSLQGRGERLVVTRIGIDQRNLVEHCSFSSRSRDSFCDAAFYGSHLRAVHCVMNARKQIFSTSFPEVVGDDMTPCIQDVDNP